MMRGSPQKGSRLAGRIDPESGSNVRS